jgi:hypothetical protein
MNIFIESSIETIVAVWIAAFLLLSSPVWIWFYLGYTLLQWYRDKEYDN